MPEQKPDLEAQDQAGSAAEQAESKELGGGALEAASKLTPVGRFVSLVKRNKGKSAATGGILGTIITFVLIGIMFLGPLKLDFLSKNVEEVDMARTEQVLTKRSNRFLLTMFLAEMAGNVGDEAGGSGDPSNNRYFLVKGLHANPITGVYKDWKTSRFFDRIAQRHGQVFVNDRDAGGRLTSINITKSPNDPTNLLTRDGIRQLRAYFEGKSIEELRDKGVRGSRTFDPNVEKVIAELEQRMGDHFENDKQARGFFKTLIREDARVWQILKRRHLRNWSRERTGIRKWRFFEGARDEAGDKVRNRWSRTIIGRSFAGRVVTCIFSQNGCPGKDLNDKNSRHTSTPDNKNAQDAYDEIQPGEQDLDGPNRPKVDTRSNFNKVFSKKVFARVAGAIGILDLVSSVHNLFENHTLTKIVAVALMMEYVNSHDTFQIIADQAKSGEKVSAEELDAALQMFEDVELSDGYQQMEEAQRSRDITALGKVFAQEPNSREERKKKYAAVTEDQKINSNERGVTEVEGWYHRNIGKYIDPIVDAYDSTLGKIVGFIGDILGPIITEVASWVGFSAEKIAEIIGEQLMPWLGIAPKCVDSKSEDNSGQKFNCIRAGAVVKEQGFLSANGGVTLTDEEALQQADQAIRERQQEYESQSLWARLVDTDYSQSLIGQLALKTPSTKREVASSLQKFTSNLLPHRLFAATGATLKAAFTGASVPSTAALPKNLWNVEYKGFRQDLENAEPFGGKSIQECEAEKATFNAAVEAGQEPPFESLCILDELPANAIVARFTDKDDGGLGGEDTGYAAGTPAGGTQPGPQPTVFCAPLTGHPALPPAELQDGNEPGLSIIPTISYQDGTITGVRTDVAQCVYNMMVAAKQAGHTLSGSAFRSIQRQRELRAQNCPDPENSPPGDCSPPTARAGTSNHGWGVAIDFSGVSAYFSWLQQNASKYGFSNLPSENWHWSINGK